MHEKARFGFDGIGCVNSRRGLGGERGCDIAMTEEKYRELLDNIDKIANNVAALKRTIILEFRPAPDVRSKKAFEDILMVSERLKNHWDNVAAVEEIKRQREK